MGVYLNSVYSLKYRSPDKIGQDLVDAASKLDESRVAEISRRINWLYLEKPMLPAFDKATKAVLSAKLSNDGDAIDRQKRIYSILVRAKEEFIEAEKYSERSY